MERAHPLAGRWRHARHGRVKTVEVPVLLAEVAGDDTTLLGLRSRLGTIIADDGATRLVLDTVAIAIFLTDCSSTVKQRTVRVSKRWAEEKSPTSPRRDLRDFRRRAMLVRVDVVAVGCSDDC